MSMDDYLKDCFGPINGNYAEWPPKEKPEEPDEKETEENTD